MNAEFLFFMLSIAGTLIAGSFLIIGFFIKSILNEVKNNSIECGKNKGRIELVEQKSDSEIRKLTEVTQLEIKALSNNVSNLTDNIQELIKVLINPKK